jgi:hypothetical protein
MPKAVGPHNPGLCFILTNLIIFLIITAKSVKMEVFFDFKGKPKRIREC